MGTYQLSGVFSVGYGKPGFFTVAPNAVVSVVYAGRVYGSHGGLVNDFRGVDGSGGYGIILAGDHSSLTNLGTIAAGTGGGGQQTGGHGGGGVAVSTNADVVNRGIIRGGGGGYGFRHTYYDIVLRTSITSSNGGPGGVGVSLDTGSTLQNYGTITGGANATQAGKYANLGASPGVFARYSVVENHGVIVGGTGGGHDPFGGRRTGDGGSGVTLNGGTLINYGTIVGGSPGSTPGVYSGNWGNAVSLSAGAATIIAKPGSSFVGNIGGGGSNHTLILDSGGPGTFAALVSGITTFDVASGGSWTILGTTYNVQTFTLGAHASVDLLGTIVGSAVTMGAYATVEVTNIAELAGSTLVPAGGHDTLELSSVTGSIDLHALSPQFTGSNHIAIDAGGTWTLTQSTGPADGVGVVIRTGGTAITSGNIFGASGTYDHVAAPSGSTAIGFYLYGGGTLINTGTLTGGNGGQSFFHGGDGAVGVHLTGAGYFSNRGFIAGGDGGPDFSGSGAIGATGGNGVRIDGSATLVNTGAIAGGHGGFTYFANGPAGAGGDGVVLNGGTLINFGKISGGEGGQQNPGPNGDAVRFGANGGTLVIEPGAVFAGKVEGNGANSHLVLGSAASAGTLLGLGSAYVGFQSLTIDGGATWDVAGTVAAFRTTAIDGFGAQDTLDLTDLAFNGSDTARLNGFNQLVIADPGGDITIQMDAGVAGQQFKLVSDGHGGSFVEQLLRNEISGLHTQGVTLTAAVYSNPVTVTGTVSNTYGAAVVSRTAWTIDNAGSIGGTGDAIDLFSGEIVNTGTLAGSYRVINIDQAGTVHNAGIINGDGFGILGVNLYGGGNFLNAQSGNVFGSYFGVVVRGTTGTVENYGTISGISQAVYMGAAHSLLIDHAGAVFNGAVVAGARATSAAIELASGSVEGTLSGLGSQFTGFGTIAIDSGAAWKIAGSSAAFSGTTIHGFNSQDRLDLTDLTFNAGDTATINASNQLVIADTHGNITIQMDGGVTGDLFKLLSDGHGGTFVEEMNTVACYLRGTRIRTPEGVSAVEDLRIGDVVLTADGKALPLKWIGRRSYRGWLAVGAGEVQPVCLKAGAIADRVPSRDLYVSPEHAMFIDGMLVPAVHLVNGTSIVKMRDFEDIDYFHLEFDRHVVIFAEGAAAESFVDDDSRMLFHNADEYRRLYPEEPPRLRAEFCAPRVEAGQALEMLQRRLGGRASRLRADGTAAPPRRRGFVDRATRTTIEGWALPESGPAILAILVNGAVVGRAVADQYRADIEDIGIGDGCCAFRFDLPRPLASDVGHCIEVRHEDDWSLLHHGRVSLRALSG